jgi:organic radical activating enzyme
MWLSLEYKKLPELCKALINAGKDVGIETSGSYWQDVPRDVFITLSPKEHLNPKYPVLDIFWHRANEFKLVISTGQELDLYIHQLDNFEGFLYLQPEYDDFKNSIQKTLNLLKINHDFKLSLQTHKILNLP